MRRLLARAREPRSKGEGSKISSANCPPSSFGIVVPVAAGERGVLVLEAMRRLSGWLWVRRAANGISERVAALAAGKAPPPGSQTGQQGATAAPAPAGAGKSETEAA